MCLEVVGQRRKHSRRGEFLSHKLEGATSFCKSGVSNLSSQQHHPLLELSPSSRVSDLVDLQVSENVHFQPVQGDAGTAGSRTLVNVEPR